MKITEAVAVKLLKSHKVNITRNRIRILTIIYSMTGTIGANRVVSEGGIKSDRVTVYRTLQVFRRKGILQLVPNTKGKVEFYMKSGIEGTDVKDTVSAWTICTECGTRKEVHLPEPLSIPDVFSVDPREILIKGLCRSCITGIQNPEHMKRIT